MSLLNTRQGYGTLSKILHWVIMVLLIFMLIGGLSGMVYDNQAPHEILGKVILSLTVLRLILRFVVPAPAPNPNHARWEIGLSHAVHWGLYAVLLLYPISGWMMVSAGDWGETGNLGFVPDAWEDALYNWHHGMKIALFALVGLHVAGALKHAILDRDGTLRRMWFGKS